MGAPRRDDSATLSSASVMATGRSRLAGVRGSYLKREVPSLHRRARLGRAADPPVPAALTTGAMRRLGPAPCRFRKRVQPLIDRRKVMRGARKHVDTIHQGKSSLVAAPPSGLHLRSVKFRVGLPTQPFG